MIANDVECLNQQHDMPKLPVAAVLWKPLPNLETSAEAWISAGGAHHSVLSYGLNDQIKNNRIYKRVSQCRGGGKGKITRSEPTGKTGVIADYNL